MATEDVGTLDQAAIAIHEMYKSYVRAGFTEVQAMELITVHLQEILFLGRGQ